MLRKELAFIIVFLLLGCAATTPSQSSQGSSDEAPSAEAPPCGDCAKQGDAKLTIVDSLFYIEFAPQASSKKWASPVGVLPLLKIEAIAPEKCKFCHAFSSDALDFEFGSTQDSLIQALDTNRTLEILMPGLGAPESDSIAFEPILDSLRNQPFADGKDLIEWEPWLVSQSKQSIQEREVPQGLTSWIRRLGARWKVATLVLPVRLRVEMDPKAGEEGGYRWQLLWTVWDTRTALPLTVLYADFRIETRGDVPPDRDWSKPFIAWLGRRLTSR